MSELQPWQSKVFYGPLLWWMFRPLRWPSIALTVLAVAYVMSTKTVLKFEMLGWVPWFVLAHCVAIVWITARVEHPSFGYLYVQGHDRDTIWRHTMMASVLSVLCVWLPTTLLIWLGVRSGYQQALGNFNYPLMAFSEKPFPLWCLLAYAVLIPIFHYAWIRGGQAMRGSASGFVIAVAAVLVAFSIWNAVRVPDMPLWTIVAMAGGFLVAAVSLLLAGRKLHQRLEVVS